MADAGKWSEEQWLREIHRPDAPQLTARAIAGGIVLGAVMCLSNLYVFFKAGWSMGVTITAGILAFGMFRGLHALRLTKTPLSLLENNALTTVASGAGYMTGGGNMAAWGALLIAVVTARKAGTVAPEIPATLPMIAWFALIAALGVFCAIPIKRQLINQEGLAFPTGTATAETLQSIHGGQGNEGTAKAKALMWGSLLAAALTWFRAAKASWMPFNLPDKLPLGVSIAGRKAADWTLDLTTEVVLVGAGALMSFRTCWSLLLGSLLTYGVLAPALVGAGVLALPPDDDPKFGSKTYALIAGWTVWPGASILVASGLTSFLLDWKSVKRSFSGMGALFGGRKGPAEPIDAVECPAWWFPAGFAALGPIVVVLMVWLFEIPWWAALLAVPLAVVMGFVAARVTGETDVTPTKALGPVTQMVYGVLAPGKLAGNIMSANVTAGIGLHAADLLTTQKTGWLVGGSPRVQFWAQLIGVAVGAVLIVPAFDLLIGDPEKLGSQEWAAPSCLVWERVSNAFIDGIDKLHGTSRIAIAVGLALGVALALAERLAPKKLKPFVPSPSGLGIAMVIPGRNGISMFLGGLIAEVVRRRWPKKADVAVVPVASGFIAGESLMGVTTIVLKMANVLT